MKPLLLVAAAVVAACGGAPAPCPAWRPPALHGFLDDASLKELSGLALSRRHDGILWAVQDSGNTPTLFALDMSAHVVAALPVDATNTDWESLAVAPCPSGTCVYIGDTGDNLDARRHLVLWVLPEPPLETPSSPLHADEVRLAFPDGAHNTEAMVVTRDQVPFLLTKRNDGRSILYAATQWAPGTTSPLERVGELEFPTGLPGSVTDASLFPDDSRLLVRAYLGAWEFLLPSGNPRDLPGAERHKVPFAPELQGEAIAYDPAHDGFWQAPEGTHAPLSFTRCGQRL